jgi:hypothetical protein
MPLLHKENFKIAFFAILFIFQQNISALPGLTNPFVAIVIVTIIDNTLRELKYKTIRLNDGIL